MKTFVKSIAAIAGRIYNRCLDALLYMAGILVVFIMLIISADVFLRFFLNKPVSWAFEMTEYSLLFITFLAAASLLKKDGHVRIDIVLNWLGKRSGSSLNVLNIMTSALMVLVCFLLILYGSQAALDHYQRGVLSVKYYSLPKAAFLMIIPVGSFFLLIECLKQMVNHFMLLFSPKRFENRGPSETLMEK